MSELVHYRFLTELDKPTRYLSLTVDELVVTASSFLLLAVLNQKIIVALIGLGCITGLRVLKKGGSPRTLLVLAYWRLPHAATRFFLPKLPASHHRVWIA